MSRQWSKSRYCDCKTYLLQLSSNFFLELRDCYCVLTASKNLISVSSLVQDDYEISFTKDYYTIYFRNKLVGCGHLINSLYHWHVDADESVNQSEQIVSAIGSKRTRGEINLKYMWHLRLGHIEEKKINRLEKDSLLDSSDE